MKFIFLGMAVLVPMISHAASQPSVEAINQKAFVQLISHSSELYVGDEKKLAASLASALATTTNETNKIENTCRYDSGDQAFKCSLVIKNTETSASGKLESQTTFSYELERDQDGLPGDFVTESVAMDIVG